MDLIGRNIEKDNEKDASEAVIEGEAVIRLVGKKCLAKSLVEKDSTKNNRN